MTLKKIVTFEDSLSLEEVAKQCNRQVSQVYNALTAGKLNEAALPQWVGKKGVLNDKKLASYIERCKKLDDNKKNKLISNDPIKALEARIAKAQAKADRMTEQVKKKIERLEQMKQKLDDNS